MARTGVKLAPRTIVDPSDPEGRQAAFETLMRSDRVAEHRPRVRAEVEHWPPRKGPIPPGWSVKEWSPTEKAAFRQEVAHGDRAIPPSNRCSPSLPTNTP